MSKKRLIFLIIFSVIIYHALGFLLFYLNNKFFFDNRPYYYKLYSDYYVKILPFIVLLLLNYRFLSTKTGKEILTGHAKFTAYNIFRFYILSLVFILFYVALILFIDIVLLKNNNILSYRVPTLIYKDKVILFTTVLVIPLVSELFFRRFIFESLRRFTSLLWSTLIVSLLFVFIRIDVSQTFIEGFLLSVLLCLIYSKYGFRYSFMFYSFVNLNSVYLVKYMFLALKNGVLKNGNAIIWGINILSVIFLFYLTRKILGSEK